MNKMKKWSGIAACLLLSAVALTGCGGNVPDLNVVANQLPAERQMISSVNVIDLGDGSVITGKVGDAVVFVTPGLQTGYYSLKTGDRVMLRENEGLAACANGWAVTSLPNEDSGQMKYSLRSVSGTLLMDGLAETAAEYGIARKEIFSLNDVWYRVENGAAIGLFGSNVAPPQFDTLSEFRNGKYAVLKSEEQITVYNIAGQLVYNRKLAEDETFLGYSGPDTLVIQRICQLAEDANKYDALVEGNKCELRYYVVNLGDGKESEVKSSFLPQSLTYDADSGKSVATGYEIRKNQTVDTVLYRYYVNPDFSVITRLYDDEYYFKLPGDGYLYADGTRLSLLNKKGNTVAALGNQSVASISEGGITLYADSEKNQIRLLDQSGKVTATSMRFDFLGSFYGGYAMGKIGQTYYIVKADATMTELTDDWSFEVTGGYALDDGSSYVFKDYAGKEVGSYAYKTTPADDVYIADGKQFIVFCSDGKLVELVR